MAGSLGGQYCEGSIRVYGETSERRTLPVAEILSAIRGGVRCSEGINRATKTGYAAAVVVVTKSRVFGPRWRRFSDGFCEIPDEREVYIQKRFKLFYLCVVSTVIKHPLHYDKHM